MQVAPAAASINGAEPRARRQPGAADGRRSDALANGNGWDCEMGWAEGGRAARRARPAGHDKGHRRAPLEEWAWLGVRWHDIGFVAAFVQMLGASLFQLSVVAGAPDLIPPADWQLLDALLWTPQVHLHLRGAPACQLHAAVRRAEGHSLPTKWQLLGTQVSEPQGPLNTVGMPWGGRCGAHAAFQFGIL